MATRGARDLFRVVENHAHGAAMTRAYPAHAMPQVHPIRTTRALHRPIVHREHDTVAATKRHHLGPRLHPRPLLGQHELAAREVAAGGRTLCRACAGQRYYRPL